MKQQQQENKGRKESLIGTLVYIVLTVALYYGGTKVITHGELSTALILSSFISLFGAILGVINSIAIYLETKLK